MAIVSSVITSNNIEADGRRRVDELHVDDRGEQFQFSYLAEADVDVDARLAERAAALPEMCAAKEIAANIYNVALLGSVASTTFAYSTRQQNGLALQAAYRSATGVAAIMMGDFIAALADAEIESVLGLTPEQIAKLRSDVLTSAAALAAAIRGASGAVASRAIA